MEQGFLLVRRPVHSATLQMAGTLLLPTPIGQRGSVRTFVHALLDLDLATISGQGRTLLVANAETLGLLSELPAVPEGISVLIERSELAAMSPAIRRRLERWPLAQILQPGEQPLPQSRPAWCAFRTTEVDPTQLRALRRDKFEPMLMGVDQRSTFDTAKARGFSFMEGGLWTQVPPLEAGELVPDHSALLGVLAVVNDPKSSMADIERVVSSDPALTARLLRAVNVGANRRREVGSLKQAVVFLGMAAIARWASLMLLYSIEGRPAGLLHSSRLRAEACSLLAAERRQDEHAAFLVGLLSRLDALLRLPMHQVLRDLPLAPSLSGALLARQGPLGKILEAVEQAESGDTDELPDSAVTAWNASRAFD